MIRSWSLILLLTVAFFSCKEKKSTSESDLSSQTETTVPIQTVNYRKTPCFGVCPAFELIVMSDGAARYEGKMNVDREGLWMSTWSKEDIEKVMKTAESIDYFNLEDTYNDPYVTDLPATYTTLHRDGVDKTIMNRYQGPKSLRDLYAVLDELIEKNEWKRVASDH